MPTDVIVSAETVAATQPAPINDYQQLLASATPEERLKFAQDGTEPKPKDPTPAPAEKAPAKAESMPATSGEEDQDHEPDYTGTPEQIAKQRHTFMRLRRERTEFKAKAELLERQLAETRKPAPAAEPKTEAKPESKLERPKRPRISDPKYANDATGELFDADTDAYEDLKRTYDLEDLRNSLKAEQAQETRSLTKAQQAERWTKEEAQLTAEERKIAFSPTSVASEVMLGVLTSIEGGPKVFLALGQNPEIAKELAEATDIPGYSSYADIVEAAGKDPAIARALGAAEALVKAEAKRLLSGSKKSPDPQPIKHTQAPAPGSRVNAHSAAPGDPIQDAYDRGDYGEGARLEAARDAERKKQR